MSDRLSDAVEGALQAADIAGHDMGVNLGGLDIRVAEQFLEDADIDSVFQHMRGEAMAQRVATNPFVDPCLLCGPLHRFLQGGFENVMTHFFTGARVA